jgi:hypothetical protein
VTSVFLTALLTLFPVLQARAQQTTADILGTVTDASGAVIPGVTVVVQNMGTDAKRTTQTGANGAYIVTNLEVGTYSVTITATGFRTFSVPGLALSGSNRARVDAVLQAGAVSETVTVEGAEAAALQTDTAVMFQTINKTAVQDLPLNGRNYAVLPTLVPGANDGPETGSLNNGTTLDDRMPRAALSVNGQSDILNQQLIDGADNTERVIHQVGVRPSIDSIQELDIQTSNYSAEFGSTAGGVVNIITKAGTNTFHGDVFEYFRNDVLDATPYEFGAGIPKAKLRQNQFGGSIGGPVIRNKTFFFFAYEAFHQSTATNPATFIVPTAFEEKNPGNFSDTTQIANSKCLANSKLCTPCPTPVGGLCPLIIPAGSIDPVALAYFQLYPVPNVGTNSYISTAPVNETIGTYDFRVDHSFNQSNSLFWRFTYNTADSTAPGNFPYKTVQGLNLNPTNGSTYPEYDGNQMLGYVHNFKTNLLLDVKASYTHINNRAVAQNSGNPNQTFGQPNVNSDACGGQNNLAPITVTSGAALGSQFRPTQDMDNTFSYMGNLIYTRGTQSIKIGGRILRRQLVHVQCGTGMGLWAFSDYPSLVTGLYNNTSRSLSQFTPTFRVWEPSVYIQDDWRARKNLALNLGVRYDVFTPYAEKNGHVANFDPATASLLIAGVNGVSNSGNVQTDHLDFQPRVGIAYTIRSGTVIRGGLSESFIPGGSQLTNPPFIVSFGPCGVAAAGAYGNTSVNSSPCPAGFTHFANGFPTPVAASANPISGSVSGVQRDVKTSHVFQYNATLQQDFSGNVATISYVGIIGRNLAGGVSDLNEIAPGACGASCSNINSLRPFYSAQPGMTKVSWVQNAGISNYNSLQASLQRRVKQGLTVNANYNWAHSLGTTDSQSSGSALNAGAGLVANNLMLDYGNATLDLRHRIAVTADYQLPFGNGRTGLLKTVTNGWHVNLLTTWQTGQAFTVLNSSNVSNTSPGTNDRANVLADPFVAGAVSANSSCTAPSQVKTLAAWFNPCSIVKQSTGTLGNERRNQLFGPHFRHLDMSLFKTFPIRESLALDFRFEGFNITNTTNFAQPTATVGSATYAKITSSNPSYSPRQLQFSSTIHF